MTNEDKQLREINRIIVSAIIISKDGKFLLGKKDPSGGGVYPDAWHIPGGGIKDGESFSDALTREVREEATLDITGLSTKPLPKGEGEADKTLETGEIVLAHMEFNRFEIRLEKTAQELEAIIKPGDDLVELKWFTSEELKEIQQIPGGREFFEQMGYIKL